MLHGLSIVGSVGYPLRCWPEVMAEVASGTLPIDRVMTGLHLTSMATALVARVEQTPEQEPLGLRTLRWSSAGHLPPLVQHADGTVDVLTTRAEPLLGADIAHDRFNQKNYRAAALGYEAFLKRFPTHPRRLLAHYQAGLAYVRLNRAGDAVDVDAVQQRFTQARVANDLLRPLRCEKIVVKGCEPQPFPW